MTGAPNTCARSGWSCADAPGRPARRAATGGGVAERGVAECAAQPGDGQERDVRSRDRRERAGRLLQLLERLDDAVERRRVDFAAPGSPARDGEDVGCRHAPNVTFSSRLPCRFDGRRRAPACRGRSSAALSTKLVARACVTAESRFSTWPDRRPRRRRDLLPLFLLPGRPCSWSCSSRTRTSGRCRRSRAVSR